jgi:hypothetical protein
LLVGGQLSSEGDIHWLTTTTGFIATGVYVFYSHFYLLTRYTGKRKGVFIHLIENAYKHSPARLSPGDLKVNVVVKEGTLTFNVQNPIEKRSANTLEEPGGFGLPNVRKRLSLIYPDQHSLTIQNTGETFTVTLTIQGLHLQAHEPKAHLLYH